MDKNSSIHVLAMQMFYVYAYLQWGFFFSFSNHLQINHNTSALIQTNKLNTGCSILQQNKSWVKAITLFIIAFNHPHNSILINLFTGEDVRPITPLDWHRPLITKDVKWGKVITTAGCTYGFDAARRSSTTSSALALCAFICCGLIRLKHSDTAHLWEIPKRND